MAQAAQPQEQTAPTQTAQATTAPLPLGQDPRFVVGDRDGKRDSLTDNQGREGAMRGMTSEDDGDLRIDRVICGNGDMWKTVARLENKAIPMPPAHRICRGVLKEEAARETIGSRWDKYDYQAIFDATKHQKTSYVDRKGVRQALPCTTAYDVGYETGYVVPNAVFQPQIPTEIMDEWQKICFAPAGNIHPTFAFAAGWRHGAEDAKVKEASLETPLTPSPTPVVPTSAPVKEGP